MGIAKRNLPPPKPRIPPHIAEAETLTSDPDSFIKYAESLPNGKLVFDDRSKIILTTYRGLRCLDRLVKAKALAYDLIALGSNKAIIALGYPSWSRRRSKTSVRCGASLSTPKTRPAPIY